jgi:hypothetical protein
MKRGTCRQYSWTFRVEFLPALLLCVVCLLVTAESCVALNFLAVVIKDGVGYLIPGFDSLPLLIHSRKLLSCVQE